MRIPPNRRVEWWLALIAIYAGSFLIGWHLIGPAAPIVTVAAGRT